ncbi:hypothetical protein SCLCIDRAFT_10604 [Scleroderma citrinum Foug A]|uniref:Uncharacterized protein n=1 Tax=Scleroderma citrinum Foug A TaxID=1036808 RepID=A0A0C2Z4I6_9AGAM|nr:hypothetical protein SCLCIDRAFT_10604 [Scleroderma citrinum Foug A]
MNSPGGGILHPNPSPSPIADGQFGGVLAVCIQNPPCATPGRPYRVRVSVNVNRCIFIPHHFLGFSWVIQLVQSRAQHVGVPRGSQSHIKAFHLPPSTAPTTASDSTLWENAGGSSDHLAQAHKHYQYAMSTAANLLELMLRRSTERGHGLCFGSGTPVGKLTPHLTLQWHIIHPLQQTTPLHGRLDHDSGVMRQVTGHSNLKNAKTDQLRCLGPSLSRGGEGADEAMPWPDIKRSFVGHPFHHGDAGFTG